MALQDRHALFINREFTYLEIWDIEEPERTSHAQIEPVGSVGDEPTLALIEGATRVSGVGAPNTARGEYIVIATIDTSTRGDVRTLRPVIVDGVPVQPVGDAEAGSAILGTVVRAMDDRGTTIATRFLRGRTLRHAGGAYAFEISEPEDGASALTVFQVRLSLAEAP
jgi:hypothetical protein